MKIPILIFGCLFLLCIYSCSKEMEEKKEVIDECAIASNVIAFESQGKTYELVKEKKNWFEATACAVLRGGYLVEINNATEQRNIFEFAKNNILDLSLTVSADGGNASYIWLGANDIATEGRWIWDGDHDGVGPQFWDGGSQGKPIDNLYNNFRLEPDNFQEQDALSMGITNWPLGVAGEWNDIFDSNRLFFVIEFD